MTAPVLLSSRQRAILEAMADGATLHWCIYRGEWRYVLADKAVDGRSVEGLIRRGYVARRMTLPWRGVAAVEMTDKGRRAVGVEK